MSYTHVRTGQYRSGYCRHLLGRLLLCAAALFPGYSSGGAYIFAGEANGVDVITHPNTYFGTGGTITVRVCIAPTSPNADVMEIPVQNNIDILNGLQPTTGNLVSGSANNIPPGQIDFESVALHEIGHCLGMAHVNLASESGLTGSDQNYTRSTDGSNNIFNINSGADGIRGSSDDVRGDDDNLHWFHESDNNPFTIAAVVDATSYSRNLADLPTGHIYAANGDRTVAGLLGAPNTEAVMQQGTFYDEAQRTLGHDDVATLLLAASGVDETVGGGDDYAIMLEYGGISSSNCDISLAFTATTGLAFCGVGGNFFFGTNHIRITSANIEFGQAFSWFFNDEVLTDSDGDGLYDAIELANGTDPMLVDTDNDGLVDGADGIICVNLVAGCTVSYPTGVDADGDNFVDGEQDFGTDPTMVDTDGDQLPDGLEVSLGSIPTDAASWPNIADGDLAPLGNPDGNINAADLLITTRILIDDVMPLPLQYAHGDLYPPGAPDGVIDLSDTLLLEQLILGIP